MLTGLALTASTVTALALPASATTADPCVSGAEVRAQVQALVASLRDDVTSKKSRAHLAAALVDSLDTFRGAKADTAAERRDLGLQIAALGKTLKDANGLVARKAIVVEILALTEQRERGPFTDDERAELKAAITALKKAVIAKTDSRAEGQAVAEAFKALHEQFNCTPA
jgi:hypothetical protein